MHFHIRLNLIFLLFIIFWNVVDVLAHPIAFIHNEKLKNTTTKLVKSCLSAHLEKEDDLTCRFYAAVIDAGSTGTRLHLYEFSRNSDHQNNPFKVENEVFKETKPGLSTYVNNPVQAALSIRDLVSAAQKVVPIDLWPLTPIVMKATAGLRLLSDKQANAILHEVENEIKRSGLLVNNNSVSMLSETDEGVYGWFTLNFLLQRFKYLDKDARQTVVSLDLGGGSTQITFVPEDYQKTFSKDIKEEHYAHTLDVFGKKVKLYTHSYLGNGIVAARFGIAKLYTSEIFQSHHQLFTDCFPSGHTFKDSDSSGTTWTINSTNKYNYQNCLNLARSYVVKTDVKSVDGLQKREIYAMGYYYERAYKSKIVTKNNNHMETIVVADYSHAARKACNISVNDIGYESYNSWQCQDLCYIYALLRYGYGMNDDQKIILVNVIENKQVSWSLGFGYHLLNTYQHKSIN